MHKNMAISLGKRKRPGKDHDNRTIIPRHQLDEKESELEPQPEQKDESQQNEEELLRARFQRAFEEKFKPLKNYHSNTPLAATTITSPNNTVALQQQQKGKIEKISKMELDVNEDANESEESDWSGISDEDVDESEKGVEIEIVEHGIRGVDTDVIAAREKKAFMSSKPPTFVDQMDFTQSARVNNNQDPKSRDENDGTDPSETANLQNDLALQRLLKESHLLDSSTFSTTSSSTIPTGKSRLKALDLRIQDLGGSSAKQPPMKMAMAVRKGITANATRREEKRRKEAAENGIILERAIGSSSGALGSSAAAAAKKKRRERAVGTPNVGRFQGGTLRLSSKDVRSIEGPKERMMGRKKRVRRR